MEVNDIIINKDQIHFPENITRDGAKDVLIKSPEIPENVKLYFDKIKHLFFTENPQNPFLIITIFSEIARYSNSINTILNIQGENSNKTGMVQSSIDFRAFSKNDLVCLGYEKNSEALSLLVKGRVKKITIKSIENMLQESPRGITHYASFK